MRVLRWLFLALPLTAVFLTSACGGSGGPSGSQRTYVPPSPNGGGAPQTVNVSITVPTPAPSSGAGRRPTSISSGTQSVGIVLAAVNGNAIAPQNPAIINVAAGSPNCSLSSGADVCTGSVTGADGIDAFTVTLYSATNGHGSVLAVGTVQVPVNTQTASLNISGGVALNLIPIISQLQLIVSPAQLDPGKAANGTIVVQPVDASGNVVLGVTGTATVTLSGGGDAVTFGKHKTSAQTALYTPLAFKYNGSKNVQSQLAVTATLDNSSPVLSATVDVPFTFPPTPTPSPTPTGLAPAIYVLDRGSSGGNGATVTVYPVTANGNNTPIRTLQLSSSKGAESIAVDASGQLHVGYNDGTIDTFAYNATGNASPSSTLRGDPGSNTTIEPVAMTIGPGGELVTIGTTNVSGMQGNTAALVYTANASGNASPITAWNFTQPAISLSGECTCSVAGLATDSAGNFYVDGSLQQTLLSSAPGIYVAPANASGPSVTIARTIPGDSTTTIPASPFDGTVAGLALDASGLIYESQFGNAQGTLPGAINVFAAGAGGGTTDVPPLVHLTGTPLNIIVGQGVPALPLAVSGSLMYVANGSTNTVVVYPASGGSPVQTITGAATGLNAPAGIAVGLSGSGS